MNPSHRVKRAKEEGVAGTAEVGVGDSISEEEEVEDATGSTVIFNEDVTAARFAAAAAASDGGGRAAAEGCGTPTLSFSGLRMTLKSRSLNEITSRSVLVPE